LNSVFGKNAFRIKINAVSGKSAQKQKVDKQQVRLIYNLSNKKIRHW